MKCVGKVTLNNYQTRKSWYLKVLINLLIDLQIWTFLNMLDGCAVFLEILNGSKNLLIFVKVSISCFIKFWVISLSCNYVFRRGLCPFLKICLRWLNIGIGVNFFLKGTTFPLLCRFRLFCTNVRWDSNIYDTIDFSFFSFPWIYL